MECADGLELVGAHPVCADGAWTVAECLEAPCRDAPAVPNADFASLHHCAGTASGGACAVFCKQGFELQPVRAAPEGAVCVRGGWVTGTCAPIPCRGSPPFVPHARSKHCDTTDSGGSCPVKCDPGFKAQGEWRCVDSAWEAHGACVEDGCASMRMDHGVPCAAAPAGAQCDLRCDQGFTAVGTLFCVAGSFVGDGRCAALCPQPDAVEGGTLGSCANAAAGSVCELRCDAGRFPTCQPVCGPDGKWLAAACDASFGAKLTRVSFGVGLAGLDPSVPPSGREVGAALASALRLRRVDAEAHLHGIHAVVHASAEARDPGPLRARVEAAFADLPGLQAQLRTGLCAARCQGAFAIPCECSERTELTLLYVSGPTVGEPALPVRPTFAPPVAPVALPPAAPRRLANSWWV